MLKWVFVKSWIFLQLHTNERLQEDLTEEQQQLNSYKQGDREDKDALVINKIETGAQYHEEIGPF